MALMQEQDDSPLLDQIAAGDATAIPLLLRRYRDRLRRMVKYRLNEHGAMPLLQPRWRRSRESRAETLWNLLTVADH